MAERMSDEKIRALLEAARPAPCPACGAKPGQPCYGNGPMAEPHPARGRTDPTTDQLATEVLELRAEIERLRALLPRAAAAGIEIGRLETAYPEDLADDAAEQIVEILLAKEESDA